jgi:hypothetical protein
MLLFDLVSTEPMSTGKTQHSNRSELLASDPATLQVSTPREWCNWDCKIANSIVTAFFCCAGLASDSCGSRGRHPRWSSGPCAGW